MFLLKSSKEIQLIQDETTFPVWNKASANEFGHLAQGFGERIEVSNTIFFIPRQARSKWKIVTYGRFVVDIYPNKTYSIYRRCFNTLRYLTTSKCLWNSTISTLRR
jgi:hypothetical protein